MVIIQYSQVLYNYFKQIKLTEFLSDVYIKHIMSIILSIFIAGYKGKTTNFECVSKHHRTTVTFSYLLIYSYLIFLSVK